MPPRPGHKPSSRVDNPNTWAQAATAEGRPSPSSVQHWIVRSQNASYSALAVNFVECQGHSCASFEGKGSESARLKTICTTPCEYYGFEWEFDSARSITCRSFLVLDRSLSSRGQFMRMYPHYLVVRSHRGFSSFLHCDFISGSESGGSSERKNSDDKRRGEPSRFGGLVVLYLSLPPSFIFRWKLRVTKPVEVMPFKDVLELLFNSFHMQRPHSGELPEPTSDHGYPTEQGPSNTYVVGFEIKCPLSRSSQGFAWYH